MSYISCYSQITFQRNYGDAGVEIGYSVKQCNDNSYITTGYSAAKGLVLLKTNSVGDFQWEMSKYGGIEMGGFDVIQTKDGNFVVCGYKCITNWDGTAVLTKIDKTGNTIWDKEFKDEFWTKAIIETTDNCIIAAGLNMYKTDSDGNLKWNIDFLNYPGESVYMIEVDETAVLSFGTQSWNNRLFLAKVRTSSGTFFWKKYLDGYIYKPGNNCLAKTSDDGFIVTAQKLSEDVAILIKTDGEGNKLWTKEYPVAKYGASVVQTPDGGYAIGGKSNTGFMILMKTNSQGSLLWSRIFEIGEIKSLQLTSDGGFILGGSVNSAQNNEDFVLVKTDSQGNLLKTLASDILKNNNTCQFFPNPFSNQTVMKTNGTFSNAILTIYTSLGQKVKQLSNINGQSYILSQDNMPNGLYFYKIEEGNKILSTGKIEVVNQ